MLAYDETQNCVVSADQNFEKEDEETTFKTMFDAYWWAIITMTTVSYFRFD